MARSLLQLPPELLAQIIVSLPVRCMLRFGETSHRARKLVISNFHTLAISFHSSRRAGTSNRPAAMFDKKHTSRPFPANEETDPHKILVRLDPAYEFAILINLHCALMESLLLRYSRLRKLDMSLWTLTVPMAKAIARLPALRELSIRMDKTPFIPRSYKAIQGAEQQKAWDTLTQDAVWAPSVRLLRFENSNISSAQLIELLQTSCRLRELFLIGCAFVDDRLLEFMGGAWCGRAGLRTLMFDDCDAVLGGEALDAIDELSGLQCLDLGGCIGVNPDMVVMRNRDVWHIKEVVISRKISCEGDGILEVDPEYIV